MSNERTLLAYLRTGIALLIAGVTGAHFFINNAWLIVSILATVSGVLIVMYGFTRFFAIRSRLNLASPDRTADTTARHISESGAA